MPIAIKVEELSKAYQLGQFTTGTISRDIERWWALVRGKEDPFLKVGEVNDRSKKGLSDIVWSLKDINFQIEQGSAVGIIGKNGAGKSTLLKIVSQVTSPTRGTVKVKGRVASLLEVGTGFHPELSGRENIFLNGAILGMRKQEIKSKFDEIVDFSGVERYIDTPVKRYSSGMYVRLAFAVAAHLESDILIVDEVLAVGDAEFQQKCLGKMGDVSKGEGKTILFVSHNMGAIEKLCSTIILLDRGMISNIGPANTVINQYSSQIRSFSISEIEVDIKSGVDISFSKISITNEKFEATNQIRQYESFYINIELIAFRSIRDIDISVSFKNAQGTEINFSSLSDIVGGQLAKLEQGRHVYNVRFSGGVLMPGNYFARISVHHPGYRDIDLSEDVLSFTILNIKGGLPLNYGRGCISFLSQWSEGVIG